MLIQSKAISSHLDFIPLQREGQPLNQGPSYLWPSEPLV